MGMNPIQSDAPVTGYFFRQIRFIVTLFNPKTFLQNELIEPIRCVNSLQTTKMGVSQYLKLLSLVSIATAAPNYAVPGTLPKNAAPLDASPVGAS